MYIMTDRGDHSLWQKDKKEVENSDINAILVFGRLVRRDQRESAECTSSRVRNRGTRDSMNN